MQTGEENAERLGDGGEIDRPQVDPVEEPQPPAISQRHEVPPVSIGMARRQSNSRRGGLPRESNLGLHYHRRGRRTREHVLEGEQPTPDRQSPHLALCAPGAGHDRYVPIPQVERLPR